MPIVEPIQLLAQIGNYGSSNLRNEKEQDALFVEQRLGDAGSLHLYKGIQEYIIDYDGKVQALKAAYPEIDAEPGLIDNKTFFRDRFIRFIAEKNASSAGRYAGNINMRMHNPESATIKMDVFLGKKGMDLYQLALEEEMYSTEYRNAVFKASTTHFEGESWDQRPVIIVAGPSGSGKSFAAQAAVRKANEFLPKSGALQGNDVVAVDGGVAREVSQMRKLVIESAYNKGYTGISDLHSKSKILGKVKGRIMDASFSCPSLGVVIPETFSNPLPIKRHALLKKIEALPNTKPIFCRVDGEDPATFQKVVAFMGSRRAWKNSGFDEQQAFDLNIKKIEESKAYDAKGFWLGQLGSKSAERWFSKNSNSSLSMVVINDLSIKKEDPLKPHEWVEAEQGDEGAILVSERTFQQWQKLPRSEKIPLKDYIDNNLQPPLIKTSGEIDFAIINEELQKRIDALLNRMQSYEPERVQSLHGRLNSLIDIQVRLETLDLKDPGAMIQLKNSIEEQLGEMKSSDSWRHGFRTRRTLGNTVEALSKISTQMQQVEDKVENRGKRAYISGIAHSMKDQLKRLKRNDTPSESDEKDADFSSKLTP